MSSAARGLRAPTRTGRLRVFHRHHHGRIVKRTKCEPLPVAGRANESLKKAGGDAYDDNRYDARKGGLVQTGFAAAIAITSTGALLNISEAWALDVKGLKPETMKTLILVARDIYPHDKVADRYYAIAMKGYDEKAAGNPEMKAQIEG